MTLFQVVPRLEQPLMAQARTGAWVRCRDLVPGEARVDSRSIWEDWGQFDLAIDEGAHRRAMVETAVDPGPQPGEPVAWIAVGDMSWHADFYGPNTGSRAINIGISLARPARGRGIGTVAQSLLAGFLHECGVHRVEAQTDVDNLEEQRSLVRAGFQREGTLRGAQWRADGRHDLVCYSCLPGEATILAQHPGWRE